MDDLVAFVRAQLDEDEQIAREAAEEVGDGQWQQRNVRIVTVADRDREVADYAIVDCIHHIIHHDPARVLADVAAKRAIIDALLDEDSIVNEYHDGLWIAVHLLASAYADRPGYQDSWRQ